MNEPDQIIVLPSNASYREFPNNSNANFKIRLPKRMRFNARQFKVGLLDVHLEKTWKNVDKAYMSVTVETGDGVERQRVVNLKPGRYHAMAEIVLECHRVLATFGLEKNVLLWYDNIRNTMTLILRDRRGEATRYSVSFSTALASVLGFVSGEHYRKSDSERERVHMSESAPDVNRGANSLYVYCSLVEPRIVGDTTAPLLRVVPVRHGDSKEVYEEVRNVHYVPASALDTDIVEVNIRFSDGRLVPFEGGKVELTVSIREV